ncbi:hypothetical protein FOZ63_027167 [Perkinsus olseni]|uniref:Uncharacterized protein n=1 Tax=Perkinsus olseni TaxID=32597 RepID=A0A7J6SUX6_PEROL|nr:hypothetical protein FOZ60_001491 [Perkinsus olseni]KAF4710056.1 hypothetical protein FOZ62_025972 [Perkinsus olseni]KAF4736547.1 hypothetical protein FOZ63_027167 [Perkinsus olseni]
MSKHHPAGDLPVAIREVAHLQTISLPEVLSLGPSSFAHIENKVMPVQLMNFTKSKEREVVSTQRRQFNQNKRRIQDAPHPYDTIIFIRCIASNRMACIINRTIDETRHLLSLHSQLVLGGVALVEEPSDSGSVLSETNLPILHTQQRLSPISINLGLQPNHMPVLMPADAGMYGFSYRTYNLDLRFVGLNYNCCSGPWCDR